jgi:RNA polymerase sigma-70 factor, ECF subfamily
VVLRTADIHLLRAAEAGDLIAFEELARRYEALVYRVALRMLGNPAEAEDAAQEVLLQLWKSLSAFRGESSLPTWLYRVTTNLCLNVVRGRRPTDSMPEEVEAVGASPHHAFEAKAKLRALTVAIGRLSPEQRAPLVLRELEGLSYDEIADALETTIPAVKGRIHRARIELVGAMRQHEWA